MATSSWNVHMPIDTASLSRCGISGIWGCLCGSTHRLGGAPASLVLLCWNFPGVLRRKPEISIAGEYAAIAYCSVRSGKIQLIWADAVAFAYAGLPVPHLCEIRCQSRSCSYPWYLTCPCRCSLHPYSYAVALRSAMPILP